MMIRALTATAGVLSASLVAAIEVANTAAMPAVIGWSALGGLVGAGAAWGAMTSKVNSAHKRITETNQRVESEKQDREKAVTELKSDMHRGFDSIERQLTAQTATVIKALERVSGRRSLHHREDHDHG